MKFKLLFIIVFLLLCMGVVCGGNNTTTINNTYTSNEYSISDFDKVYALEDGHFNTSFSDGFNGYCVEYGETEASKGDMFLVSGTDSIRNSVTGKECGDYLKVYFIDYYNDAQRDKIVTQHMIWHFTDDFNGWRLNYTLIDLIKDRVDNQGVHYTDSGYRLLDDNLTVLFWDFHSFLSPYINHQDYFGYRIWFGDINDIPVDNNTSNDTLNNNSMNDNSTINDNITLNNSIINTDKEYFITNYNHSIMDNYNQYKNIQLYNTGFNLWVFFCMVIMVIIIVFLDKKWK